MKKTLYLIIVVLGAFRLAAAQSIPEELWGTWVVRHVVPTTTVSCWGEEEAKSLIGTEIEYSAGLFRWNKVVAQNPKTVTTIISTEQFHNDNSGGSTNDSQVTFEQLGINAGKVTQVVIEHPDATITGTTNEIPGDRVIFKDRNAIIFSVCNVYFEAERSAGAPGSSKAARCGVDRTRPPQRIFADPDGKHGWHEYRSVKDVPELQPGFGQFAEVWAGADGKALVRLEEANEDFAAYTNYCFEKNGQLIAARYELRTAWGWGYREEGSIVNGKIKPQASDFFDTKNEAPIAKPAQSADVADALRPHLYATKSRLPFAPLLSE